MDFKLRYAGSVLSYGWAFIRPLALFGILYLVFSQVFRFGADIPYYPALLVFNIVLFFYFTEAVGAAVGSVVANEPVVRKTQFPRAVIPLSVVLSATLTVLINLALTSVFFILSDVEARWTWLLFPLVLAAFFLISSCLGLLFSALFARFRDVSQAWTVISRILFYGAPILYPIEVVPENLRAFFVANPVAPLFIETRRIIFEPGAMSSAEAAGGTPALAISIGLFVGICVLGVWYFVRRAPRIAEDL
jgi:ABC-2 type transport system permease protein